MSRLDLFARQVRSLTSDAATTFDGNAPADLNAHIRARDLGEANTVLRARIGTRWTLRNHFHRVFRRLTRLLRGSAPGRQQRQNKWKNDFSHRLFY